MKLSIIMPVYNEKDTIIKILNKIENVNLKGIKKEIIIVDDFSTDGTRKILNNLKNKYKILYHKKNYGKGMAIRTAIREITGDFVLIQDADLEYNPEDYKVLLKPVFEEGIEVVYGSRFLGMNLKDFDYVRPLYYLGNKLLTVITNVFYNANVTDMETCYKLIKSDIIKKIPLRSRKFDFEPEITSKILKRKHKIVEVPISYNPRSFKEGKKINWRDGIKGIWILLKYRFID